MSDSVRPHRWQPTRLLRSWDLPGKSTGVGCHFLLQCMKVKSESEVAQSCQTLSDPMDCRQPGSSIHGIFQARVLERGPIAFSIKQVLNPGLLHFRQILYQLNHKGSPGTLEWVAYPFRQRIFLTQESNQGLLHCRQQILYQLNYLGSSITSVIKK